MPAFVGGPLKIVSISGGQVIFGDTAVIAPKETGKAYTGSGGGLTGDFSVSINGISNTNTIDTDAVDSNTGSGL